MAEQTDSNSVINQYELQLKQVENALKNNPDDEDKQNLLSLQSDIKELIELTRESSEKTKHQISNECQNDSDDVMDMEYNLFKSEIRTLEEVKNPSVPNELSNQCDSIEDDLKDLEGTKCCAPFGSSWGGISYHNAMICSIADLEGAKDSSDIMVKVLFINPTHKEMLPCPYFLDGSCKFSEDQCHFSHGHSVPFNTLKEYKNPDYSNLKIGSRVLAKNNNNLWHRALILQASDNNQEKYMIKFESSGSVIETDICNLLPLESMDINLSDSSDESDSENEIESINNKQEEVILRSLSNPSNSALGQWEKHTRGIGSKLMGKMGYIMGTGLGKESDGRIEPVQATVLPPGKSLDHCMKLKENAGGDKDLFSVERKMRKQAQKAEIQRNKEYSRLKNKEKNNVFEFINSTLGDQDIQNTPSTSSYNKTLKSESSKKLNVESFKIGENIAKLEKESVKLKTSLTKHSQGSIHYNNIIAQINGIQKELLNLKTVQKSIATEQKQRKTKAKLTIF